MKVGRLDVFPKRLVARPADAVRHASGTGTT